MTNFYYFYKNNSPYSNFYKVRYTKDGIEFKSSEQGFMYDKAVLFGDDSSARDILNSTTPLEAKKLGRKVQNFDQTIWNQKKVELMYNNVYEKFKQNDELKQNLLKISNHFVEASPTDKIWGIGLNEENAKKVGINGWKGQNLLGQVIDKVRDDLKQISNSEP